MKTLSADIESSPLSRYGGLGYRLGSRNETVFFFLFFSWLSRNVKKWTFWNDWFKYYVIEYIGKTYPFVLLHRNTRSIRLYYSYATAYSKRPILQFVHTIRRGFYSMFIGDIIFFLLWTRPRFIPIHPKPDSDLC